MAMLVTGGLGVNGAPVLRKLVERNIRTIVIDPRNDLSLLDKHTAASVELVVGDCTERALVERVITDGKIDTIIHMGAIVAEAQQVPLDAFRVNAYGTVALLDLACARGVKRFVFTSSRGVYGEQFGETAHPTYRPISEDDPVRPARVYDVCKVAAEGMGRNYALIHGIEFIALRFATIFGPGKTLRHKNYGILSNIIESGLAGMPVRVSKGGDQKDDFIYVEDAAEAVVTAALHSNPRHDTFNISHCVGSTLHDLAAAVRTIRPSADIQIGPGLNYMGWDVNYAGVLDNRRAAEELEFRPKFDLTAAVAHYAEALQQRA